MTTHHLKRLGLALGCLMLFLGLPARAWGQNTTGRIEGLVTDSAGTPLTSAEIVAKNAASGVQRDATTRTDGTYTLAGLAPATYVVTARSIGMGSQAQQVTVQIGQVLTVNFTLGQQTVQLEEITTVAPRTETQTSEVATNVTQAQIEQLPSPSRNFLDLAQLAPGVTVTPDRINGTGFRTFSGVGQDPSTVNVFVDGTSLKNDLTGGGVTGQDASRGNPFPRNSIQEYRVISQNFKAEYQNASSSLITAVTKSGGNTWSGNAFFTYQDKGLVALDTFQIKSKNTDPNFKQPDYSRKLLGLSAGGPIIRDRLHFFGSYEGNYQDRSNTVNFTPPPTGTFPALDTVNLGSYNGQFTSPFRETLLFGKLSYAVTPNSSAELSFNNRHETDIRDFGNNQAFQEAVNFRQNISIGQLHYNWFKGPWLNEAKVAYTRFRRNPSPNDPGLPARLYQFSGSSAQIGSNLSTQDFTQKGIELRNDLTYSGLHWAGNHVIKIGANANFLKFDVLKDNNGTPQFFYRDTLNGVAYDYQQPFQLVYGTGNPLLNTNNTQLGVYLQDDWTPTPRLTINAGVRWDFETKMFNTDYVTPQNVVDTLTRYNDSLPHPLNLNDYISTGSNRHPFYGAFQPRLGFSYALDRDAKTTIYGAFGIFYDRTIFDVSVDETLKLTHPTYTIMFAAPGATPGPGEVAWNNSYLTADRATLDQLVHTVGTPEAWLISKNVKVPYSRQWNLGVRRTLGHFNVSATYAGVRGINQLTLNWANFGLNPDGSCCTSFNLGAHGFSNFIYSSNDARTWYDALQIQVQRPYRRASESSIGWGAGLAFTYAWRSLAGIDNSGDLFAFPNTQNIPKHPANDERARVVANWVTDLPYLFGIQWSGLITLGSGNKQDIGGPIRFNPNGYVRGGFSPPGQNFLIFGKWVYRNVDMRLAKTFPTISGQRIGVTLDVFNVFNYDNFGCFATPANQADGSPDPNLGTPNCVVSDPRRAQLGVEYNF